MREEVYCELCEKLVDTTPFIGEKYHKFKDGVYCGKCAKIRVEKNRGEKHKS